MTSPTVTSPTVTTPTVTLTQTETVLISHTGTRPETEPSWQQFKTQILYHRSKPEVTGLVAPLLNIDLRLGAFGNFKPEAVKNDDRLEWELKGTPEDPEKRWGSAKIWESKAENRAARLELTFEPDCHPLCRYVPLVFHRRPDGEPDDNPPDGEHVIWKHWGEPIAISIRETFADLAGDDSSDDWISRLQIDATLPHKPGTAPQRPQVVGLMMPPQKGRLRVRKTFDCAGGNWTVFRDYHILPPPASDKVKNEIALLKLKPGVLAAYDCKDVAGYLKKRRGEWHADKWDSLVLCLLTRHLPDKTELAMNLVDRRKRIGITPVNDLNAQKRAQPEPDAQMKVRIRESEIEYEPFAPWRSYEDFKGPKKDAHLEVKSLFDWAEYPITYLDNTYLDHLDLRIKRWAADPATVVDYLNANANKQWVDDTTKSLTTEAKPKSCKAENQLLALWVCADIGDFVAQHLFDSETSEPIDKRSPIELFCGSGEVSIVWSIEGQAEGEPVPVLTVEPAPKADSDE